jgi:Uma2 family endonuclease
MATFVIATDAPLVDGPPQGRWTYADWEKLPADDRRFEVIAGVLYMSTAPSYFHQYIILQLVRYIGIPAEDQRLARIGFAPIGVLMPGCDPVQPDFVVVLAGRAALIHDRRIRGTPDLIVEILSPSNRAYDEQVKLQAYARAGVPEYATVDPTAQMLRHYRLNPTGSYEQPEVYDRAQSMSFDCLSGLLLPVGELFAGAQDTTA